MIGQQARSAADLVVTIAMIVWLRAPYSVPVEFENLPADAITATVVEYRTGGLPREGTRLPLHGGSAATLVHEAGVPVVVTFTRADGAYVLDGPFTWPEQQARRSVDAEWRRTVSSTGNTGLAGAPLQWISPDMASDVWPLCAWSSADRWECRGVGLHAAGVVVAQLADAVAWTTVGPGDRALSAMRRSRWGRLVRIQPASGRRIEANLRRLVPPPAYRLRSIRMENGELQGTVSVVTDDSAWIAANDDPPDTWVEVSAGDLGPAIVAVKELLASPLAVTHVVPLPPPNVVRGSIRDTDDAPVSSALVTLFRLIDPPETPDSLARHEPRARRVGAGQVVTGADGVFSFDRLPAGEFELLTWHAQLGRSSLLMRLPSSNLTVRLAPAAVVRGRVLLNGRPASDVPVVSVPDPSAVSAADDLTELKGGDGRTDQDGRFVVALAARAGGELRIGGEATSVRRLRLPSAVAANVDLGEIELPSPITLTLVLDQDPGCGVTLVGPLGHAGLQIVTAMRTHPGMFDAAVPEEGDWRVTLTCPTGERAVAPGIVSGSNGTRTVNLRVQ